MIPFNHLLKDRSKRRTRAYAQNKGLPFLLFTLDFSFQLIDNTHTSLLYCWKDVGRNFLKTSDFRTVYSCSWTVKRFRCLVKYDL